MTHDIKAGEILVGKSIVGLSTTARFYKVVKATDKTVTVRLMQEIWINNTADGSALIVPSDEGETEIGEPMTRYVKSNRIWIHDNTTARAWGCFPEVTENIYM